MCLEKFSVIVNKTLVAYTRKWHINSIWAMSYIGPKIAQKQQQSVSQSILPKVNTIRNRIKRTM